MKIIREDHPIGRGDVRGVELTRRNLTVLLAKLDDSESERTILQRDGVGEVFVRAVEDAAHYSDRAPGVMLVDGRLV
jgi:hypothetical protein